MIPRFLLSFVFLLALIGSFSGVSGRSGSPVVCIYPGERIGSHPAPLTTNPNNFRFTINGGAAVTAGSEVTIQLTGAAQFIGFLGYVTDANTRKVGTFNTATFTDQSLGLYECDPAAPGSTLGHSSKTRKGPTVSWGWKAPANAAGTMTVRALVMTAFSTYYSITQTFTIGAAAPATTLPPATTLAPATTIPNGNGGATTKAPTIGTTTPRAIVTTAAQTSAPTNGPPVATTFLSPDLDFFVSWKNNGDGTMDFTMATNGNGYVSIGICNGPLMRDTCDYITGWIKQGKATLIDTYSVGRVIPRLDTSNGGTSDVTEVSSTALGTLGGTSITFRRKLVTNDAKDVDIINAEQYIQWAYTSKLLGTETPTNYPLHDADGYFQANLLAVDGGQPSATTNPVAGGTTARPDATTASPAAANSYTSDDKKFYAKWKKNNDGTIDITMETSGKGWVSFGICDGPEMANKCDYITGWVNGNTPVLLDTYADVYNIPPVDADNGGTTDVQMISYNKVGSVLGGTSFTFRRKLDTGDTTGDLAITDSVQYFQYAYTNNAVPTTATKTNYPKHSDYGVFQTNLLAASAGVITTAQPAATTKQVDAGQVSDLSYTSKDGKFTFNWQIIGDKIRVTMSAATLGWISVGWCDGPKMPNNCDYVTGGIDGTTGTPYLYDTYSDSYDMPPIDTDVGGKNDYTLVPGTAAEDAAAGTTTLTFERLLNTNDPKDYPITNAPIYCQWSYGPADGDVTQKVYPQHARGAYGAVIINFYQGGATEASEFQARISNGAWLLFISLALFGTWVVMRYARKAKKAMHASTMKSVVQNVYKNNDVYDPNSHKLFKNVSDRSVVSNQVAIDVPYDGRHIRNASQQPMSSPDSALQRWRQQWIPIQTEDGYTYYYNSNLQETAWEIPEMPELFGRDTDSVSDYGTGAPRYTNNSNNNSYNNYNNAKGSAPSALSAQLTLEAKKGGGCCTAFRVVCASRLPCTQLSTSDLLLFGGFLALNALCFFALDASSSTPRKLGYLASANFVLVCIPATRNSPLIWLLGFPFDRVIVFHRWLAPWTFAVTSLHMIAYIQEWKGLGLNVNKMLFSDQENYYGFLSWLFTALVLITSWEFFRRRYFNFFYFAHFMFIAVFVLAYLHVPQAFLPYVFVIIVVYGLDRLVRFLWSVQCTSTVKLVPKDSDILLVRFKKNWLAKALNLYKIGQYVFVNFPGISPLAWHPFTLSSSPEEQTAEVHIRGLGDYTKKLIDQVKLNNGSPMMIRVDGPYGNHRFTYRRYPSLLLFGGGIGITPIVAMLRDIYRVGDFPAGTTRPPHVIQSIYVAWIVPNAEKYKWFQAELEQVWKTIAAEGDNPAVAGQPNGLPYLSIWVYASRDSQEKCNQWSSNNMGTTFVSGKPDFDSIFSTVKNNHSTQAVSVFACGPASLTSMVWDECSAMQSKGHRFDFHHETFDW